MQVPEVEAVSVVPSQAQPVALPLATDVMDSAPVEDPPVTEVTVNGVCEYGNALLVALNTGAEIAAWFALPITNENEDVVATVVLVSVIRAVIAKVPPAVGVPETTPVAPSRVKPAGNDPVAIEKVPDPEPPLFASVIEYAAPTVPVSPEVGVVIATAGIAYLTMTMPAAPAVKSDPPPPVFAVGATPGAYFPSPEIAVDVPAVLFFPGPPPPYIVLVPLILVVTPAPPVKPEPAFCAPPPPPAPQLLT